MTDSKTQNQKSIISPKSENNNSVANDSKSKATTFKPGEPSKLKGITHCTITEKAMKNRPRWEKTILDELALHFGCLPNTAAAKRAILANPDLAESWDRGERPNKPNKKKANLYKSSKYKQFKEALLNPENINCELIDLALIVGIDEGTAALWKLKVGKQTTLLDKSKLRKEAIEESLEILIMDGIKKIRFAMNNPAEIKKAKDVVSMISTIQACYKSNISTKIVQINNEPTETALPELNISISSDDDANNKCDDSFDELK